MHWHRPPARGSRMSDISVAPAVINDLLFIDDLQRKNAEELSFYPKIVFEREIENQRILLAKVNGSHAGYLYHGAFGVSCKIHQACITYDLRGQLYGSQLVNSLRVLADLSGSHCITLRCGSDIAANSFWKTMGFHCEAIRPGGVRRMRDINCWRLNLQAPLFTTKIDPSSKQQDASFWRKRDVSLPSQFLRGKDLVNYRKSITGES